MHSLTPPAHPAHKQSPILRPLALTSHLTVHMFARHYTGRPPHSPHAQVLTSLAGSPRDPVSSSVVNSDAALTLASALENHKAEVCERAGR